MNNLPRQKLLEIVGRCGRSLVDDSRRCEGLMRDYFPAYRREIAVLTTALEERIPAELLDASNKAVPRSVLLARLAQRLHDDTAMEEEAARWATHTWSLALGVVSLDELTALEEANAQETKQAQQTTTAAQAANAKQATNNAAKSARPISSAASSASIPNAAVSSAQSTSPSTARTSFVIALDGSGDFLTITDAIRRAPENARLLVRPGIYYEGFVIDKSLEIIGDGVLEEIIVSATASSCVVMQTDEATVRNLTLRGQAKRGGANGDGFFAIDIPRGCLLLDACDISSDSLSCVAIHNKSAEPVVRGCRIHHAFDSGVYAFDGAGGRIEACDIFENTNVGIAITGGATTNVSGCHVHDGGNAGIVVWDNASNMIEDCEIYANASAGIGISEAGATTVRRCRIHEGRNIGIYVHQGGRGAIEECDIYAHTEAEVAVTSEAEIHLRACRIHQGQSSGVVVRDAGKAFLEACDVFQNGGSGVHVDAGGIAVARKCRINENHHVGVGCDSGGAVSVENCDLTENRIAAWETNHGATVESRNNRF